MMPGSCRSSCLLLLCFGAALASASRIRWEPDGLRRAAHASAPSRCVWLALRLQQGTTITHNPVLCEIQWPGGGPVACWPARPPLLFPGGATSRSSCGTAWGTRAATCRAWAPSRRRWRTSWVSAARKQEDRRGSCCTGARGKKQQQRQNPTRHRPRRRRLRVQHRHRRLRVR
jgi:hypothetical protein